MRQVFWHRLLETADVGLVRQQLPPPGNANHLQVNLLGEKVLLGSAADVEGVAEGSAPTMLLEDLINTFHGGFLHKRMDVTFRVTPGEQGILRARSGNSSHVV